MNSFFNNLFKTNSSATYVSNSINIKKAPAPDAGALNDIYKNPLYHTIRSNIVSKQTHLINHFHDMAFIASCADKTLVLSAPFKTYTSGKNKEEQEQLYIQNKAFTQNNFKGNIAVSKKLDAKYKSRYELFKALQTIYPTFGLEIEKKIPKEDFELLQHVRRALKHVIYKNSMTYEPKKHQSEVLLEYQDSLSEVIDSELFAKACNIEDCFMIKEIDTFFKMYSTAEPEKKKPLTHVTLLTRDSKKISPLELAHKIRNDRVNRTKLYDQIAKLYEKLGSGKEITIKIKSPIDFEK